MIIALLVSLTAFGVIGYQLIEGWSFADALYMTIITLSTTGFGEVIPLSQEGRVFTMFLIVLGLCAITYASSALINELFRYNMQDRRKIRMQAKIDKVSRHAVVLGFGRMGKSVCEELADAQFPFVVVERAPNLIKDLSETKYLWLEGDAADDSLLVKTGLERAAYLVSVVNDESDGLFSAIAAKVINPNIKVIVRADSESSRRKMLLAGADRVFLPYTMTGIKIARSLINPEVEDIFEVAGGKGRGKQQLQIVDFHVEKGSKLNGRNLLNCGFGRDGLMVVGVRKEKEGFMFAPPSDLVFREGDTIVAIGTPESCKRTLAQFSAA